MTRKTKKAAGSVRLGPVLMMAVALLATGCGGHVRNIQQQDDFDPASLVRGKLALGGVVLGPRAELDRAALEDIAVAMDTPQAQSDTWAPVLYREFLQTRPDLVVWPWPTVKDLVTRPKLDQLLESWSRGRVLQPDQVTEVGDDLQGVGFLVLARIDGNHVSTEQSIDNIETSQRAKDGREVHANSLDRTVKSERELNVVMEVYDLASGASVWYGTVTKNLDELYNSTEEGTQRGLEVKKEVTADDQVKIKVPGSPLRAPDLEDVLEDACEALIEKLPGGN